MHNFKKFAPFIVSIILISIIVHLAPWDKVIEAVSHMHPVTILLLLMLSVLYYAGKAIRFWYMLKVLKIIERPDVVSLVYMAAQPVSLLPAGEIFRAKAMETYRGVPMDRTIATFSSQGIFEGLGIGAVALVGAIALGYQRIPAIALLVIVVAGVLAIRRGYLTRLTKIINAIPFVEVSRAKLRKFSERNQLLLKGRPLKVLLSLSFAVELVGVAIAYFSVTGLGGHINIFQAALVYSLPVVVSFLSFLPGGFGASEQSAIGLLLLLHQDNGLAVAATLVMRVTIVLTGVIYGAIAYALVKLKPAAMGVKETT